MLVWAMVVRCRVADARLVIVEDGHPARVAVRAPRGDGARIDPLECRLGLMRVAAGARGVCGVRRCQALLLRGRTLAAVAGGGPG